MAPGMPENIKLELLAPPPKDAFNVDILADSALKSFAVIEPWYTARTEHDHHLVTTMVESIVSQAKGYLKAITMSLKTVQDGCTFAEEAMALCDLISGDSVKADALASFVKNMVEFAEHAHVDCAAAVAQFRVVRSGLFQIIRSIPATIQKIRQEVDSSGRVHGVKAYFVTLPVPWKGDELTERRGKNRTFSELILIGQFDRANDDLAQLIDHVGHFANWWGRMQLQLGSLQTVIPLIKNGRSETSTRIQGIRGSWASVKDEYIRYQSRIAVIQDYYPKLNDQSKSGRGARLWRILRYVLMWRRSKSSMVSSM